MGTAAIAVGAVMGAAGTFIQNHDAAQAEEENAKGYAAAQERSKAVYGRKLRLLKNEQRQFKDRQLGMFAKAGVSMAGSGLDFMAGTEADMAAEQTALQSEANWDLQTLEREEAAAKKRARNYRDPLRTTLQIGGQLLSSGSRLVGT